MPFTMPALLSEGFGTGDSSKTYPIPLASQITVTPGAASFADGFPPLTRTALDAGGVPPSGEDMQGILYTVSEHIAYLNSGGQYPFDAGQAAAIGGYSPGAMVQSTVVAGGLWFNVNANQTSNPDTVTAYQGWYPVADFVGESVFSSAGGTVVAPPWQAGVSLIAFNGTLTSNLVLQLPPWVGKNWILASYATHNGFTISVETTTAGSSVVVPPGGYAQAQGVFVDNIGNLYSNNVSTAGLAPLASPGLTGVPTAPTAPTTSNTTQIANAAFTQAAIAAAIAGLAPLASPTLSGSPTAPTAAAGTNNALLATTAFVQAALSGYAPINSPALTGVPTAATAAPGTNTAQLATTAYVRAALPAAPPQIHTGDFTCANGVVSVPFGITMASVPRVFVQWRYASPTVGWVVPGSETTTGFQYQSGNAGVCHYSAQIGNV